MPVMQNVFGDSLLIGYFCEGLSGTVHLGYVLSLPSSFKNRFEKKKWLLVYQDYLLLILTTSCLRSLSKKTDNYFSEKETLICTLGKYKQYFCSCLQKY